MAEQRTELHAVRFEALGLSGADPALGPAAAGAAIAAGVAAVVPVEVAAGAAAAVAGQLGLQRKMAHLSQSPQL